MSFKCKIGMHSWNGCKCSDCERTRDDQHDWSKDCEKCFKCGKTRKSLHKWDGYKCSQCGRINQLFANQKLVESSINGNIEILQEALNSGANIFTNHSITGWTAPMLAASKGYIDIIKIFLAFGLDVNSKHNNSIDRKNGMTMLMMAASTGNVILINELLEIGAEVSQKDSIGATALYYAACLGRLDAVKILIAAGSDVSIKINTGKNILISATISGYVEIVKELIAAGAGVNVKADGDGYTALMAAAGFGKVDIVKLLFSFGADPDLKTNDGLRAINFAEAKKQYEIVNLINIHVEKLKEQSKENHLIKTPLEISPPECPICKKSFKPSGMIIADREYYESECNCGILYDFLYGYNTKDEKKAELLKNAGYKIKLVEKIKDNPYDFSRYLIRDE